MADVEGIALIILQLAKRQPIGRLAIPDADIDAGPWREWGAQGERLRDWCTTLLDSPLAPEDKLRRFNLENLVREHQPSAWKTRAKKLFAVGAGVVLVATGLWILLAGIRGDPEARFSRALQTATQALANTTNLTTLEAALRHLEAALKLKPDDGQATRLRTEWTRLQAQYQKEYDGHLEFVQRVVELKEQAAVDAAKQRLDDASMLRPGAAEVAELEKKLAGLATPIQEPRPVVTVTNFAGIAFVSIDPLPGLGRRAYVAQNEISIQELLGLAKAFGATATNLRSGFYESERDPDSPAVLLRDEVSRLIAQLNQPGQRPQGIPAGSFRLLTATEYRSLGNVPADEKPMSPERRDELNDRGENIGKGTRARTGNVAERTSEGQPVGAFELINLFGNLREWIEAGASGFGVLHDATDVELTRQWIRQYRANDRFGLRLVLEPN